MTCPAALDDSLLFTWQAEAVEGGAHAIDMSFGSWSHSGAGTTARFAHTLVGCGERLFLFGGVDFTSDLGDLLVADVPKPPPEE
eukprot:CAMPEP_0206232876 /NCGR_PEP_ID=MMETSP0047_2-20121206/11663_1 /ASSEMBLY_ACC=CAM_ASM_000192 /TAXON_ID=195065 /ORGANISM="Chroomonas mesostigmatica_cf, Strain CCMP1168" /LENGTH=83 /DNA_ID=CAMNT_0053656669 /DNA_START=99 /DNA_END=350 /DNA_ORIENTATION=-